MNKKHYIAMAGLSGYLPNVCNAYKTKDAAVETLCNIHDISTKGKLAKELRKYGIVYLDLKKYGNEYMEVIECDCNEPWIHDEDGDREYWEEE